MTAPNPPEPLAEVADVEAYLQRSFTDDEKASAERWLRGLSAIIRARVPGIDARISDGGLDSETVKMILAFAVKRILDFLSKSSEQTGVTYPEFGATFRQQSDLGSFITADDWLALGLIDISGGAYSVPLGWPT